MAPVDGRMRVVGLSGRVAGVKIERALERLGGVATAAELVRLCSRRRLRIALARGRVVRDGHGRYSLPDVDEALRAANRLSGVLCLDSAALYHGWKVKTLPHLPAVAVPRNRKLAPERRKGLRIRYVDVPADEIRGRATGHVRTVMDCAARMPFDDALAIADSALRAGDVTRRELVRAAERMPDRYLARCVRVAEAADARADNPFESVLRAIALDVGGLCVEPQVWIGDRRADLVDETSRIVLEAESFEFHGVRKLLRRDCKRYNAFVLGGWLVLRFAWEHVMFEPEYVRQVLEAAVELVSGGPDGRALDRPRQRPAA
jgi:very-short-patch-repair endonuclease